MDMQHRIRELSIASESTQLERIGGGSCGTVWAVSCPDCDGHAHVVMKREENGLERPIYREYEIHQKVLKAFLQSPATNFDIPRSFGYLDSQDSSTWSRILPRLPMNFTACNAIFSEKIMSFQTTVRRMLIRRFLPDVSPARLFRHLDNDHCLIRPYLGRRKYGRLEVNTASWNFLQTLSLQNFPVHLNQMELLGLDPSDYAIAMADALAFLHWVAEVDGNDVEFVLAPTRGMDVSQQMPLTYAHITNTGILGPHTMWILDFDLCRHMTLDESGVEQACSAFWSNEPWYPRPRGTTFQDQKLWELFEDRFLESSARALATRSDQIRHLPRLLMAKIKYHAMTTFVN